MIAGLLNQGLPPDAAAARASTGRVGDSAESFDALLAQPNDRKPGRPEPTQDAASPTDRRADRAPRDESPAAERTEAADPIDERGDGAATDADNDRGGAPTDTHAEEAISPDDTDASDAAVVDGDPHVGGEADVDPLNEAPDEAADTLADATAALVAALAESPASAKPGEVGEAPKDPSHAASRNATQPTTEAKPTPATPVAVVDRPTGQAPTADASSARGVDASALTTAGAVATPDGDASSGDAGRQGGQPGTAQGNATLSNAQAPSAASNAATYSTTAAALTAEAPDPGVASRPTVADAAASRPAAPTPINATLASTSGAEPDSANAARLARGLQSALNQRGGGVTLRLTPAEMGTIRIRLDITAGRVAAEFQPTTQAGQQLLQGQLAQLRSSLESQGLTVDRLGVQPAASTGSGNAAQNNASFSQSQQDAPDGRQASPDGRSRGEYGRSASQSQDDASDESGAATTFGDALDALEPTDPLAAAAAGA